MRIRLTSVMVDDQDKALAFYTSVLGLGADLPVETLVTLTLADQAGKTLLTLQHAGLPAGEGSDMTEAGWRSQLDRLAEALGTA